MSLIMSLKLNDHPATTYPGGVSIIKEATPGGKVFILKQGEVTVSINDKKITTISKPGEIFGEIASIKGCKYGATVTTNMESSFYIIDNLTTYLKRNPDDAIYLLQNLCDRIISMNENFKSSEIL